MVEISSSSLLLLRYRTECKYSSEMHCFFSKCFLTDQAMFICRCVHNEIMMNVKFPVRAPLMFPDLWAGREAERILRTCRSRALCTSQCLKVKLVCGSSHYPQRTGRLDEWFLFFISCCWSDLMSWEKSENIGFIPPPDSEPETKDKFTINNRFFFHLKRRWNYNPYCLK